MRRSFEIGLQLAVDGLSGPVTVGSQNSLLGDSVDVLVLLALVFGTAATFAALFASESEQQSEQHCGDRAQSVQHLGLLAERRRCAGGVAVRGVAESAELRPGAVARRCYRSVLCHGCCESPFPRLLIFKRALVSSPASRLK